MITTINEWKKHLETLKINEANKMGEPTHSALKAELKSKLTNKEFNTIKEIGNRTYSGTNIICVKFNNEDDMHKVMKKLNIRRPIMKRYGIGFNFSLHNL